MEEHVILREPVVCRAMQWLGDNLDELLVFLGSDYVCEVDAISGWLSVLLDRPRSVLCGFVIAGEWLVIEPGYYVITMRDHNYRRKYTPLVPLVSTVTLLPRAHRRVIQKVD